MLRSLKIEDLESLGGSSWPTATLDQKENAYTAANSYYPSIYANEKRSQHWF